MRKNDASLDRLDVLKEVFNFMSQQSEAIVLRKADCVLESTIEEDIDLLLSRSVENEFGILLNKYGFKKRIDNRLFNTYLYGSEPHIHYISVDMNLHFDIVYSVIHRSLWIENFPGFSVTQWLPLHQDIQDKIWRNRNYMQHKGLKIPVLLPIFELLHIICHVILDKRGVVSDYYSQRIYNLISEVDAKELEIYLEKVFYAFASIIIDRCMSKELKSLYVDYISFKGY